MPTHAEKRVLPFTRAQLFNLVADIEKYPEFLPWCVGARVRSSDGNVIYSDLVIGYKMFRERFTTTVTLDSPGRIDVVYAEGPFRYLNNHWVFEEQPDGMSCAIDFFVDFEFRSRLMNKLIGPVFNEAVRRMVHAFEQRAHELYS